MNEKSALFKKGENAAKLSAVSLALLTILKGSVSLISGSVALLAITVDSFSDVFSSIAVWIGLKLARKKPSERFPYGYYKAETFALLMVSAIIAISSVWILIESVDKFLEPTAPSFTFLSLAVAALSAVIYYALARYKSKIAREIGSQSLSSEAWNSKIDVYISALAFICIFLSYYGYQRIESLAGFAIGIYVLKGALWFGKDATLVLMDASLSPEEARELKKIAEGIEGVKGVHAIRLRKSGPVSFAEMHIEVPEDIPFEKAHDISDEVEQRVKRQFKDIESITIHIGPVHREKAKIAIPIVEDKGLDSMTAAHFANIRFFGFVSIQVGQINSFYVKPNKAIQLTRKKGIETARFLVNEKVDIVLAENVGEGPFYLLRDNVVQIYVLPTPVTIKEAINLLNENKLMKMTEPTEDHEAH